MKRLTTDQAIELLAELWRDDNYCAPKDYYIEKLTLLCDTAVENYLNDMKEAGRVD